MAGNLTFSTGTRVRLISGHLSSSGGRRANTTNDGAVTSSDPDRGYCVGVKMNEALGV
ncbi:hypothetical protein E2C01_034666 [Portunus trituberculatus]|uniref:Uncharacterized protein n=1 Tax=Portunus trituberculatus TaxID=210409 RepID=A0A5B7F665_PORTR|nr:hypothetical protein [Portunus trituberculatus]